jgi:hypothetical protein
MRIFLTLITILATSAVILLIVVFLLSFRGTQNATATNAETIIVWHDDNRAVTCWVYGIGHKGGLSCIPDSQLEQ